MKKRTVKALTLVALLAFVLGLAACNNGGAAAIADTIIIARIGDAGYLDPNEAVGISEVGITQQIYQTLVANNDDCTEIIPCLATDWTISEDGKTYTFTLREGVKFSDGTEPTAEDWLWSIDRAKNCETSSYTFMLDPVDTYECDGKTITFHLKDATASFLANLTNFNVVLGKKAHFDELGAQEYSNQPLGTGPYMLNEWVKEEYILLEANPEYWEEGLPKTKFIKYVVIPDDNTRLLQLQAGEIDIMPDIPFTLIDQIADSEDVRVERYKSTQVRYFVMNTTKEPFTDVRVRQAVVQAIDKQAISDLVAGDYGAPADAHVPEAEGKWSAQGNLETVPYDVEAAKNLLAEAGYPDGIQFECSVRSGAEVYIQIATLMKSQLAEANIDMTITQLERATINEQYTTLNHQSTLLQWLDDVLDPTGVLGFRCDYAQSDGWYTGNHDVELEEMYRASCIEQDEAKRLDMIQEIQQKLYNNFDVVALFRNEFVWAVNNNVENVVVTPFNVQMTSNMIKNVADK